MEQVKLEMRSQKPEMQKWLFFDLGSTLLDETSRVRERTIATAAQQGVGLQVFEDMLRQAAQRHPYVLKMDLPGGAWVPWPARLDPLYPGVQDLLLVLHKKYHLGVIANHGVDTAQQLGIAGYFDMIITSEGVGFGKPDLHMFQLALERANCVPEDAVMIGDRLDNDIAPAKQLGIKTIWIRQGWGGIPEPRTPEETPDWQVRNLEELRALLCSNC